MRYLHRSRPFVLILLLFLFTRLHYSVLPYSWPDEALFSSPAASLAEEGRFATPVLESFLPGMEQATLWNSPLFMVLLGGVYAVTGESRSAGRALAFVLGAFALLVFCALLYRLVQSESLRWLAGLALVNDLTFIRASNLIRMDVLTLLWLLSAVYCFVRALQQPEQRLGFHLLAGLSVGLAAISHPIAVLLIPVSIVFVWPRVVSLVPIAGAALAPLSMWTIYILRYPNYFPIQFLPQVLRKGELLTLWGGDTGGILIVFASSYQGGRFNMIVIGFLMLVAAALAVFLLIHTYRNLPDSESSIRLRLVLAFLITFGFVLVASEAWYPLFVGPLLVLMCAFAFDRSRDSGFALSVVLVAFVSTHAWFAIQSHVIRDDPARTEAFVSATVSATANCGSVYLRVRPDPYFELRELKGPRVYQFLPGKLNEGLQNVYDRLRSRPALLPPKLKDQTVEHYLENGYDHIDCFLVDGNESWEPLLTRYLIEHKDRFELRRLDVSYPEVGVTEVRLYQRKNNLPGAD